VNHGAQITTIVCLAKDQLMHTKLTIVQESLFFYILRKQGKGPKFVEKCLNLGDKLILIKNLIRTLNFFPSHNQVVSFFERRQVFNTF